MVDVREYKPREYKPQVKVKDALYTRTTQAPTRHYLVPDILRKISPRLTRGRFVEAPPRHRRKASSTLQGLGRTRPEEQVKHDLIRGGDLHHEWRRRESELSKKIYKNYPRRLENNVKNSENGGGGNEQKSPSLAPSPRPPTIRALRSPTDSHPHRRPHTRR